MSCQVTYNQDGTIKKVLDSQGNESQLFLGIAKSPMVNSLEEALDIYKQSYKFIPKSTEEKPIPSNEEIIKSWFNYLRGRDKSLKLTQSQENRISKKLDDWARKDEAGEITKEQVRGIHIDIYNIMNSEAGKTQNIDLTDKEYTPKRKGNIVVFVDPKKILDQADIDDPDYSIRRKENRIGNRVETAKEYLDKHGREVGSDMFSPSIVSINKGKISFEDGRHRILAAEELGINAVPIEVPAEQASEIENSFSVETGIDNKSADTQDFFSDVVTGKSSKYKPKKAWTPSINFTALEEKFKSIYEKFKGLFDEHIATSIPTFRETQIKVGSAVRQMLSPQPKGSTQKLIDIKNKFLDSKGLPKKEPKYSRIDDELFKEMAQYHKDATDDRQNPEMLKSYRAFFNETRAQYEVLVAAGYSIEPWMEEGEPYGVDSNAVREDVLNNKHLYYLRSKSATGENNEGELTAENYIPFESSGIVINGDDVLLNDLFRAVHDIFGHVMVHNTFSPQGEYNAYKTHAVMYSEAAQKALFMETVVDNAWYAIEGNYAPRKIYDVPQRFIDKVHEDILVYDIGGSEGGFVKAITEASEGAIESINLDPNPDMKKVHESAPVEGSEFVQEAFYESFEDGGTTYKKHVPEKKADVVHESMVFQFITPERAAFVKEVKDNYLKEGGVFLTEEKLIPDSEEQWKLNEASKNEYKSQYYTKEQLEQKTEEVLVGMKENQTLESNYVEELRKNFKYVRRYWSAGNFKGYIATDSKQKLDDFFNKLGGKIEFPRCNN